MKNSGDHGISRRDLLVGAAASAAATAAPSIANTGGGQGGGGGAGAGEATLLTTQSFINDDGSRVTNAPAMFGVVFAFGEGPSGTEQIAVADSEGDELTHVQFDDISRWPDGTVSRATCATVVPTLGAGAVVTYQFGKKSGTYSASPLRTVAEIEGLNLHFKLRNATDGRHAVYNGGELVFEVNSYINNPHRVEKTATGPVVDSWQVDGALRRPDGAKDDHGWAWAFIDMWSKPDGGYLDCAVEFAVLLPWKSKRGATGVWAEAEVYSGKKLLRDFELGAEFTSADVKVGSSLVNLKGHPFRQPGQSTGATAISTKMACRLRSTGTLPAPLIEGATYYVGGVRNSANQVLFRTAPTLNGVSLTDAGEGTHTIRRVLAFPYRTITSLAGSTGLPDFLGGSKRLRLTLNRREQEYWIKSAWVPPYDLDFAMPAQDLIEYIPNTAGSIKPDINGTGGSENIGPVPAWVAKAFVNQDRAGAQAVRVNARHLGGVHLMGLLEERERASGEPWGTLVVANNGPKKDGVSYEGLGPVDKSDHYLSSGNKSPSYVNAAAPHTIFVESTGADGSHWPSNYHAYLTEGGRMNLVLLWASANRHIVAKSGRNPLFGDVQWHGVTWPARGNHRSEAWRPRETFLGSVLGGEELPQKAYFRDAFRDNCGLTLAAWKSYGEGPYAQNGMTFPIAGVDTPNNGQAGQLWHALFLCMVHAWAAKLERSPEAQAMLAHSSKWCRQLADGSYCGSSYYASATLMVIRKTPLSGSPESYRTFDTMAHPIRCDATTDGTVALRKSGKTGFDGSKLQLTEGDRLSFISYTGGEAIPGEVDHATIYYMRDVDNVAKTFKVALTPSGAALAFANNMATAVGLILTQAPPVIPPNTGPRSLAQNTHDLELYCAVKWCVAAGVPDMKGANAGLDVYKASYDKSFRIVQFRTRDSIFIQ